MQTGDMAQQLTDDLELAGQLLELAEAEQAALITRDLPALENLLSQKQPLIGLLAQHGRERAALLQSKGLGADREGLVNLLSEAPERESILQLADQLGEQLERCHAANEQNGRLIRSNQAAVGGALAALRGGAEAPDLYDNRGGTTKVPRQRPLSQA